MNDDEDTPYIRDFDIPSISKPKIGPTCKLKAKTHKNIKSISSKIDTKIDQYKKILEETSQKRLDDITELKKKVYTELGNEKQKITGSYFNMPWRSKRPDVTLLVEILLAIIFIVLLYKVWPYMTGSVKPTFSKEQFLKATKMSPSAFSVAEVAKVNLEVKAFQDYADYFRAKPFSPANSGVVDLMVANAVYPIFLIFVQYFIPPFVIAYIMWFIVRFWPYVKSALWGLFVSMYGYFTSLIQGKLGCKWYIRMVTGWGCDTPDFSMYFNIWRIQYVDRPIYMERLSYIKKYYEARKIYYEIPYRKYITIPVDRYRVKAEFAKKIYVDRSVEVFLKKLRDMYPQWYMMPRDELYQWLLGSNKNLAGMYAKMRQAKRQVSGQSYPSITPSGKVCACPATDTPISLIKKGIQENKEQVADDLQSLVDVTNSVYDKLNNVSIDLNPADCGTADKFIENRHSIAKYIVITILTFIVSVVVYSNYMGTPYWVKSIFGSANMFIYKGTHVLLSGQSYNSWIIFYGIAITSLLGFMYFT